MSKTDRQAEQLKHVSGGGQSPGTNWGATPGEATTGESDKDILPNTKGGNEKPDQDADNQKHVQNDK